MEGSFLALPARPAPFPCWVNLEEELLTFGLVRPSYAPHGPEFLTENSIVLNCFIVDSTIMETVELHLVLRSNEGFFQLRGEDGHDLRAGWRRGVQKPGVGFR